MSNAIAPKIIRAPGTIVKNPVGPYNDPNAYPWGGTVLGPVRGVFLTCFDDGMTVWAEEFGEPADQLEPLRDWGLGFFARGWDDDVVASVFANTGVDPVSQHTFLTLHGDRQPGQSVYDERRAKILFAPENPRDVPAVLAYAAVPVLEAGASLALSWSDELGIPLVWRLMRDPAEKIGEVRRLWDLES